MPKTTTKSSKTDKQVNKSTTKGKEPVRSTAKPSANSTSKLYSNFLPITLEIPSSLPTSSSSKSQYVPHTIYIRPHVAKGQDGESSRTLFTVNLPVDISERDLRTVFGRWGVIENIEFTGGGTGDVLEQAVIDSLVDDLSDDDEDAEEEEVEQGEAEEITGETRPEPKFQGDLKSTVPRRNRQRRKPALPPSVPSITSLPSLSPRETPYAPSGTRNAHITYLDTQPVNVAMKHIQTIQLDKYNSGEPTGLNYYLNLHSSLRPGWSAVKEFADSSMARFDHLQSMLLSSRAKKQGAGALVDEDGFTVVVRGGRYGRTGGRGKGVAAVGVASKGFKGDGVKGKGAGGLPDFYRFQQVDRKRKELADLRNKFEQDKVKVEEMKRSKRFKPY